MNTENRTAAKVKAKVSFDLTPLQLKEIKTLLAKYLPNTAVWAYGSRIKGNARSNSDLDIVAFASPEQAAQLSLLREALEESNLPFTVDFFVWDGVPEKFKANIKRGYIELQSGEAEKNVMGSEWPVARLGDYVESCLGKMLDKNKNKGEFHPYLGNKSVRWGDFDLDNLAQMPFEDHEHERYGLKYGDLIICEGGEPGRCAIWKKQAPNMKIQKALHRVRPKSGLDNFYLYYWFLWAGKYGRLEQYFTGTTIKHLTGKALSTVELPIPPLTVQKGIANILGSLDNKIQLNRQTNQTLEQMAQALFKSWFVDFDPVIDNALAAGKPIPDALQDRAQRRQQQLASPDHKPLPDEPSAGLPKELRQLFPSEFELTEELGWVPKGWEVCAFSNVAEHIKNNVNVDAIAGDDLYFGLEHFTRKHIFLSGGGRGSDVDSNKSAFRKGDLLFGKLRPYFHKVAITQESGICSTDILVFRPKLVSAASFMYLTAFSEEFVEYSNLRSTGTRMPRASAKDMLAYKIVKSCDITLQLFEDMTKPIWERGAKGIEENAYLSSIRDTLLPKLISGELRLPSEALADAEQPLANVIA